MLSQGEKLPHIKKTREKEKRSLATIYYPSSAPEDLYTVEGKETKQNKKK